MSSWLEDARYALRALAKRPRYAATTALVFAIAIGANTTVFSVLNAFLLRPLPYPDGDRLVMVYDSYPKIGLEDAGTSVPDYLERCAEARSLQSLAILAGSALTLGGEGAPERVLVGRASPSLFEVLRVAPALGRAFTEEEATVGNDRVAVLSHDLWRDRFGGRSDVLNQDVRLDGQPFRIVGVMPEGFGFPNRTFGAWVPFAITPEEASDGRRGTQFSISVGRLRPGATVEGLNAELAAIVRRNVEEGVVPQGAIDAAGFTGRAQLLRDSLVGDIEQMLLILQAIVFAVLLIACANVANFQLTRMAARRKELAMRSALGASEGRLVRLVLIESMALALLGAAVGLVLALGGIELVRELDLDRSNMGFEFAVDGAVLGFTLGGALLAAVVAALPPVIGLVRDDLVRAVHEAGRMSGGVATHRLRSLLVVVQVAVSVALLVGAGLLIKSFHRLQQEGPGFDAGGVWTANLTLPRPRYAEPESWALFQEQALAELAALPGVSEAAFTSVLPFGGNNDQGSTVIDGYVPQRGEPEPHAQLRSVSEGYFAALGMPVIAGRNFAASEAELVAIVDETLAAKYWPNGSALGQRVRRAIDPEDRWYSIVGVVPAVKHDSLAETAAKETIYFHYKQRPRPAGAFAVRTMLPPEQLTRVATDAIARLDPELALHGAQPLELRVLRSLGPQRTPMVLTVVFAAVAFTLAVVGIYGVLSWAVTQRTAEIGMRIALGAAAIDVVPMIVKEGGTLLAVGLAFGMAAAIALGELLASQIGDVSATDPAVYGLAVAGLSAVALLASWLPARRAARIEPMRALRQE